jgi:hypothetical protein
MLGNRRYDWDRFWVESHLRVEAGDSGFFADPLDEHSWLRPAVESHRLEQLTDDTCLVLLGEPGLGKSQAVKDAVEAAHEAADQPVVERLDLGAYPDAGALRAKLIEGEGWQKWAGEGRILHLYLDSLDEAMLQFPSIHKFLLEEFATAHDALERLRLRVVCRSAEWITDFSSGLGELWHAHVPAASVRELSLAPLRERDVRVAARAEDLDVEQFVVDIRERDVEGLAALPLTLRMLIAAAKEEAGLPDTRAALYERGVQHLVSEPDATRERSKGPLGLEVGERLALSERVAAATLLARRSGIALTPGRPGPGDVDPAEIAGFTESNRLSAGADRFKVGDEQILETLRSALFTKSGPQRVSFAHRSLADYCAGACLAKADLDHDSLSALLFATSDEEGRLVPQLREVAAWAAALNPVALQAVLAGEPEVLLRVDRLDLDDQQRAQVVDAILNVESAERIERWDRRIWRNLATLDHPSLPDQLNPLIADPDANWSIRRLAITIARVCELKACEPALLTLAQDRNQPAWVRDDGVWALRKFGSREAREALIPLALESIEDDADDEIKGSALTAVFPELISVEQVFDVLTPPRNQSLLGAYTMFLHRTLPEALDRDGLKVALKWAAKRPPAHEPLDAFYQLADDILARAWPVLGEDDEIVELVIDIVRPRLKAHVDLLGSIRRGEDDRTFREADGRHRLIEALTPDIGEHGFHAAALVTTNPDLLLPEDFLWVLERLEASLEVGEGTSAWAEIARMAFSLPLSEQELQRLADLCERSPELNETLGHWLAPIEIESSQADNLREHHRFSNRDDEKPNRTEELDREIETKLVKAENGEADGWGELNYILLFDRHGFSAPRHGELEADLTTLPGWQRCSASQQKRVLAAAFMSLQTAPPDPDSWFATQTINRPAFAGYRALYLIAKLEPDKLESMPPEIWGRWMSIIVDYPVASPMEEQGLHDAIRARAARSAEADFTKWAERKIAAELDREGGHLFFLSRLEDIAPAALMDRLMELLLDEQLDAGSLSSLLRFAADHDPQRALGLVRDRLEAIPAEGLTAEQRSALVAICATMLARAPELAWPAVFACFKRCADIGKEVLTSLADDSRSRIPADMSDERLAELAAWTFHLFPEASDPPLQTEAHFVSPREHLGHFRRGVLNALAERGSDLSVDAIEAIHQEQKTGNLRFALRQARDARRAKSPAPQPGEVVRALHQIARIPPADSEGLLKRVIAVLGEIQRAVQVGQPPMVGELWNTRPEATPKDEGDLSNWLAARLQAALGSGFDVSRERLARGGGQGRGKSTDLQVVCHSAPGSPDRIELLIEVKGCWERGVKAKMKTQLVEGYMAETGIDHAIYLVFWFDGAGWSESDYRRGDSAFDVLEEATTYLASQAAQLSGTSGGRIETFVFDGSQG